MQSEQTKTHLSRVSRIVRVVRVLDRLLQNVWVSESPVHRSHIYYAETASTGKREDGVDAGEMGATKSEVSSRLYSSVAP
jgi:hypothetical protein